MQCLDVTHLSLGHRPLEDEEGQGVLKRPLALPDLGDNGRLHDLAEAALRIQGLWDDEEDGWSTDVVGER